MNEPTLPSAATVGCGRMGAFASKIAATWTPAFWQPISHLEAIESLEELRLVGAVDIDPATRIRVEERYRTPCYASVAELFDNQAIDVLTLATRTPDKIGTIRTALAHGVRTFHIEKPLCNSLHELVELQSLLADSIVTYGCFRRYLSPYRDIQAIAVKAGLTRHSQIQVNAGRGMLYWTHPHSIDMMLMLNKAEVTGVQANLTGTNRPVGFPTTSEDPFVLSAVVLFEDGCTGTIGTMPGSDLVVGYDEGSLMVESDGRTLLSRTSEGDDPYLTTKALSFDLVGTGGTSAPLRLLASAMAGDDAARLEVDAAKRDMFRGQAILFAMLQSHAQQGAKVALDQLHPDIGCQGLFKGLPA
jgi:scyllo-inositol 2-dehydrogenase (NAD+)